MPVNTEATNTMTRMNICRLTPMAALPVWPTKLPTIAWSMMPCNPPMTFCTIVGHASRHTARVSGPSTIERSNFDLAGAVSVMRRSGGSNGGCPGSNGRRGIGAGDGGDARARPHTVSILLRRALSAGASAVRWHPSARCNAGFHHGLLG